MLEADQYFYLDKANKEKLLAKIQIEEYIYSMEKLMLQEKLSQEDKMAIENALSDACSWMS